MSDIFLSGSARNQIRAIAGFDELLARTQTRLTTSQRVNSVIDDASAFFTSRDLATVANSYTRYIQETTDAINAIQVAADASSSIDQLLRQTISIVNSARASSDVRTSAANSINAILQQVALIVADADFLSNNLLSNTNTFDYRIGNNTTSASGGNLRLVGAGVGNIGGLFSAALFSTLSTATSGADTYITGITGVGGTANILTLTTFGVAHFDLLEAALTTSANKARSLASTFSVSVGTLQIRAEFSKAYQVVNRRASEQLIGADLNEEGANLVTLQTRRDLGIEALAAEGRNVRAVLNLLR